MKTGAQVKLGAGAWGKTKTEPKVEPVKIVEPEEKVEKKAEKKKTKKE